MFRLAVSFLLFVTIGAVIGVAESAYALQVDKDQVILGKLDDYKLCQDRRYSANSCHDALVRWVEAHPDDAFQAGKLTRKSMNHWVAVPFFARAFDQKKGDCNDKDVSLAVTSALNLSVQGYKQIVVQAKRIGLDICFKEMKEVIVEAAVPDSNAFKNICNDLVQKGVMSGLKRKKCAAVK